MLNCSMIFKLLKSSEIDQVKRDHLICNSEEGNVYALFEFLSQCEREWMAWVLFDNGNYLAGIPLQIKSLLFFRAVFQDPFAHELGIFMQKPLELPVIESLLNLAFNNQKLVSAYYFNVHNSELLETQKVLEGKHLYPRSTFILSLNKPYEEIKSGYSTNRNRDLKKSQKYHQLIRISSDVEPLISIFRNFTSKKIKGIKEYQYALINSSLTSLLEIGIGELYHVEFQGKIVSAVYITKFNNKIVFLFGAHSEKAFEMGSSTLVLDHILRKYSGQNYVFDFEGSDDPNLARYYSGFGARKKFFYEYRKNELPFFVKAAKKFRSIIFKKFNPKLL